MTFISLNLIVIERADSDMRPRNLEQDFKILYADSLPAAPDTVPITILSHNKTEKRCNYPTSEAFHTDVTQHTHTNTLHMKY